jgi:hypothetical protein
MPQGLPLARGCGVERKLLGWAAWVCPLCASGAPCRFLKRGLLLGAMGSSFLLPFAARPQKPRDGTVNNDQGKNWCIACGGS